MLRIIPILVTMYLFSCGKKEEAVGLAGLAGSDWSGQFQTLGKDGSMGEPAKVSFSFFQNNSFQTVSLANVSRLAKGDFQDMPRHQTVLLNVKESNFDEFSLNNQSKALEYSLADDELVLKNHEGIYTLVRAGVDGVDPTNPFMGTWACKDDQEGSWGIDINGTGFFARRTQKGTKALSFTGSATFGKSDEDLKRPDLADLAVTQASQTGIQGIRLRAEMDTENTIDRFSMTETNLNGKTSSNSLKIKCDREG